MKNRKLMAAALILTITMAFPASAGEWKTDDKGYWYQNDDGSYPVNRWQEIDGKQYYFDANGTMLAGTTTPDGKQVGADGALIEAEKTCNITYTSDSVTQELAVTDWICGSNGSTTHIFEITNNSPRTIRVDINESAKNRLGQLIGAGSTSERDIPSGCTVFATTHFTDNTGVVGFDTTFQTKWEEYFVPVLSDIAVETTIGAKKVIVKITNNGDVPAEFVEATAVFFRSGEVVYVGRTYLTDADYELKPGATIVEEIRSYFEEFDEVKVHLTARGKK